MEPTRVEPPEPRLLLAGALFGMLAIVALPLTQTAGAGVAVPLVFATPAVLVVSGRLRSAPALVWGGAGLAALLLLLLVLTQVGIAVGPVGSIAPLVLLAGPAVAVVAVGLPLRQADLIAGAAFLGGGTVAVIAGFAAAAVAGATSLVVGVGLVAFAAVAFRIGRLPSPSAR